MQPRGVDPGRLGTGLRTSTLPDLLLRQLLAMVPGHLDGSGVVNSNVERALARSLAIGFGSFSVKNELKTDAEMKDLLEKM